MVSNRLLTLFVISTLFLVISCSGKKDIFKDPSLARGDEGIYKVNGEGIILPAFFNLPSGNNAIKLVFEKPGMKPAQITLTNTVDGWRSDNGKVFANTKRTGLVIDFFSGRIYEMPDDEVESVLSKFTADNVTVIKATYSDNDPKDFTRLAVEDGVFRYGKDELKRLNLLNGSLLPKSEVSKVEPVITEPSGKPGLDRNVVITGRPVISAAANGQYDRLLRLLSTGGNINEIDEATGDNALIKAIINGDNRAANLLLDNNINPKVANKEGKTPLHVSSDIGYYDISKRLLDAGLNPNAKDNGGNTPLMYAAVSPNPFLTDLLVERGGKLEERNKKGETPLALAALTGNTKTVENLIHKGADINTNDNLGNGVLMKAVAGGNEFTAKSLIGLGAAPDMANKSGVTPLHTAIRAGDDTLIDLLLDKGADVNAKDPSGNTPLMLAAATGDSRTVDKILSFSPNINEKNIEDKTAYNIAQEKGFDRIARVIGNVMQKLDDVTLLLFGRVAVNDAEGVARAIENGARINATDTATGNTPLFTAVANNFNITVNKLITLGADVNSQNLKGNTPLIIAATSSDPSIVDALVSAGAKVDIANSNGDTPLIWAVKLKRVDVVRMLLMAGANPNHKNSEGVSPYMVADGEGTLELVNLLQAAGGHR